MTDKIEKAINSICDHYCKYPTIWDEEKEGCDLANSEVCRNCPLNSIEDIEQKLKDIEILCKTEIAYISTHWLDYHYPSEARSGFETVLSHLQEEKECANT